MKDIPSRPVSRTRTEIAGARRIVVKVGTNVVMREDGAVAIGRLYGLVESIANLRIDKRDLLVVSSGAVGLGAQRLTLTGKPGDIATKQACAAVGQSRLMSIYEEGFGRLGLVSAQVLLTEDDFSDRRRYLNLRATLARLLELGAIPILNENDTVSTVELEPLPGGAANRRPVFGDNDKLSALVASKMEADLLILLSDVDGLYTANPAKDQTATLVSLVTEMTPEIERTADGGGLRGRGGMATKLEAARIAMGSGTAVLIANGRTPGVLDRIFSGEPIGTLFLPGDHLSSRKRWIAWASAVSGRIVVNDGARKAILERKASLLPAGVVSLEGSFERGEVAALVGPDGVEFARGIANYSKTEASQLRGLHSKNIGQLVAKRGRDALVSRENIVVEIRK